MQSSLEWFGELCLTWMIYLYPELAHLPIKTGKVRMMAWGLKTSAQLPLYTSLLKNCEVSSRHAQPSIWQLQ